MRSDPNTLGAGLPNVARVVMAGRLFYPWPAQSLSIRVEIKCAHRALRKTKKVDLVLLPLIV
ncbi:MAG: hypothetical protein ACI9LX_003189 [Paraglaciecola sp.]|jgi:hypothetical protein